MPRTTKKVPSYRLHKGSGQAIVTLSGKDIYLGKHGTEASHEMYRQVIAEWLANHQQPPASSSTGALPDFQLIDVNQLFVAYWEFGQSHYVKDGKPTLEMTNVKHAVRFLIELFGTTLVRNFRPSTLKAVRQAMIDDDLSRKTINDRINRIRRIFRWGVENDMVPPSVLHGLDAVAPLRKGRGNIREGHGVKPVPESVIDAIMSHVPPMIRSMVRIQQYTGMRPGELITMRTRDLDIGNDLWTYRPESHKTDHLGHDRIIYIGQQAQSFLQPYLNKDLDAFIFSARIAMDERWAASGDDGDR